MVCASKPEEDDDVDYSRADISSPPRVGDSSTLTDAASAFYCFVFNVFADYGFILVIYVVVVLSVYLIYKTYLDPVCYIKEVTEVGFEHVPAGADRDRRIARAQATRSVGNSVPPPYPNGWFAVAESRELAAGSVMSVDALGENLCVYRGEDGVARVVDTYCPHLGANIGVGGRVCGASIVCPFHKWKFDASGACVQSGLDTVPPKGASIKTWQCVEADGAVWVWHDAEGRGPRWPLRDAHECGAWGFRGRNEYTVSAHIQEIPENGADVAHLNVVHSTSLLSKLGEKYPLLYKFIGVHVWDASWKSNQNHTATLTLSHHYRVLDYELFHVKLQITQIGPGHVRLRVHTPLGPFLISQSVTPVGPLLQKVVHRFFSPVYNAPAATLLIISEGKMIERDIKIWNNKRFVSAPPYVKADKTIRAYRTWFAQFYSDHSLTFREANNVHFLEW